MKITLDLRKKNPAFRPGLGLLPHRPLLSGRDRAGLCKNVVCVVAELAGRLVGRLTARAPE